jgi:hypothetical protein
MEASSLQLFCHEPCGVEVLPVRGVRWVLGWAAALVTLLVAIAILSAFAYQLAAEQALTRAAVSGIREAALPRATSESIEAVIQQQLANHSALGRGTKVSITLNGSPARGEICLRAGDRLSVALSVPAIAAFPRWLWFMPWKGSLEIVRQQDQQSGLAIR